ncbi:MAG: lipopolysaccharide core heptose(I) kinase RfaP [Thermodesulfobacteriota bacterium]|nr:lipopolysaccharide core heptose(I) kinase RfaP [Thermodesulfobacteriota bacterium]
MVVLPKTWLDRWRGKDIFKELFALEGMVYKKKRNRKTLRFALQGKQYFAKLHQGVGWKEVIKNLLRLRRPVTDAQNESQAIQHLEQLGIKTARLVGYGKRGWNPARLQSFVITEELANTESLENFCSDWPTSPPSHSLKRALITEVAKIARRLHGHGINHRDFYVCHFLLDISSGRENIDPRCLTLYLIDLHRMQIRNRIPQRWRVKDIAALYFSSMEIGLTQRDLLRFVRVYRNKPLKVSLEEDKILWSRVSRRGLALHRRFRKRK